jgi:hypothetical protein
MSIYDNIYEKTKGKKTEEAENENFKEDDSALKKQYSLKKSNNQEESLSYADELEAFRRSSKEQKNYVDNKKEKLVAMLRDLRASTNIRTFEEKIKIIKRNLEEVTDKSVIQEIQKTQIVVDAVFEPELQEVKDTKNSITDNKNVITSDILLYPLSLLNSTEFDEAQKEVIQRNFEKFISNVSDKVKSANIIQLDQKKDSLGNKVNETNDDDLMTKISAFEVENQNTGEGFDIDADYKDSLKDEDMSVDISEDLGLQDAYYKPIPELNHRVRTEDPIPFEYYLNDDGFWNNYISFHRSKIHPRQFMHKPFNPYKNNIRKNENL